MALAPLTWPIISSPNIKSLAVPVGPSIEPTVIDGGNGSLVSLDSNTP